ncbi:MAG: diguanylate cyclase [Lachnospiraceae bacterium]|jgi:diguanylate cyclase (GGDEF)-like protein|nr:diguanylate cyclase [Lachnospiraceae bacterium]MCI8995940.1 diguanylate cyclase [Lachnospiraceae bacterium]MCI9134079.1 diguanylate cyclase [Lachnospiraceae bacterium]
MESRENANVRKKILIVDDSEINRSLLSDMLSDEFDILEAENGMEASAILNNQEQEISLMLLDIVMPVMDGFEMLAVMNKNGWIKSIPVVMISAETVPSYVDRAYDLGVLDYISRPFDERTVRRRVISTIMLAAKQKELVHMVTDQIMEKERDNKLMVEILSNIVEFRNGESGLHVRHIRTLTEMLLRSLLQKTDKYPIGKKDIPIICNAAALHDIGKIAIPSEILNKPGRLTNEEFEIMKTHSAEGASLLKATTIRENEPLVELGYQICRWHHERYDGRGYPDGLKGDEIPITAQVVALADVYDALTSERVYKAAYSHQKTMEMILNGECGTFNPLLLECLRDISEQLEHQLNRASSLIDSQEELQETVDQIMERGGLDASERTLRLLEHERTKYQFFAELSQEIQFEYTATPEMLTLSEWGAKFLELPETLLNPREEGFGNKLFAPEDFDLLLERLRGTSPEQPMVEQTYLLHVKDSDRWSKVIARSMWGDGEPPEYVGAIGKIVDIHEDIEKMNRLEVMADHDPLTGLLNHKAAKAQISEILATEREKPYILLFFDLDHFKQANDKYGHQFGDEVLKYMAETLKKSTRSADVPARMGGDEFLVFMEYKADMEAPVKRIFNILCGEFKGFPIRVSMGVSCALECGGDYETLFRMADEAMYAVKQRGRNGYCFYNEDLKTILKSQSEDGESQGAERE